MTTVFMLVTPMVVVVMIRDCGGRRYFVVAMVTLHSRKRSWDQRHFFI